MKHLPVSLFLIGTSILTSTAAIAENLWDVVEDAQKQIIQKYPSENSIAREMALKELKEIAGNNKTEEQKIEAIRSKYPVSEKALVPSEESGFSPMQLLYRAPLQWTIHSIEIAYDVDSATNILLSTESLYQEENRKNRDESKGVSSATKINAGAKTKLDADMGGGINIKGWNPFKWFSAKAGFEWVTSGYAGIDYDRTKNISLNRSNLSQNNYACCKLKKRQIGRSCFLEPDEQFSESVEPGVRNLNNPSSCFVSLHDRLLLLPSRTNMRRVTILLHRFFGFFSLITGIGTKVLLRFPTWFPHPVFQDGFDLRDVMSVCSGYDDRQRDTMLVDQKVTFGSIFFPDPWDWVPRIPEP